MSSMKNCHWKPISKWGEPVPYNLGDRAMKNEPKMPPMAIKWNHIVLSLQKLVDVLSLRRSQGTAEQDINDVTPTQVILASTFFKNKKLFKYIHNMIKYTQWVRKCAINYSSWIYFSIILKRSIFLSCIICSKLSEKFKKILKNLEQISKIQDNIELCLLFRTTFLVVNWFN